MTSARLAEASSEAAKGRQSRANEALEETEAALAVEAEKVRSQRTEK
jgi:hypothetical protein